MEPGRYCEFGAVGEGRTDVKAFSDSPYSSGPNNSSSSNGDDGTSNVAISLDMELESIFTSMDLISNPSTDSRRVSSPWYTERCFNLWGPYGSTYDLQESSLSSFSPPNVSFDSQYLEHRQTSSMHSSSNDALGYYPLVDVQSSNPRLEDDELISECFNHPVLGGKEVERNISSTVSPDSSCFIRSSPSSITSSPAPNQEKILESVWSSLVNQKSCLEANVGIQAVDKSSSDEASNSPPEPQEKNAGILEKIQNQLENFKPFFAEGGRVLNQAGYYHTGRKFEDLLEKTVELKARVGSVAADIFNMTSSDHTQHTARMNITHSTVNAQATHSMDSNGINNKRRRRFPPSRQQKPAYRPKYNK